MTELASHPIARNVYLRQNSDALEAVTRQWLANFLTVLV